MRARKGCTQGLGEETRGKRLLVGPRLRWKDNIKMDFLKGVWSMDWVDLIQDRNR